MAYHGVNDKSLRQGLARLYAAAVPSLAFTHDGLAHSRTHTNDPAPSQGLGGRDSRVTVGFVSRFFYRHSVGNLLLGMAQRLSRKRYRVVVFSVGGGRRRGADQDPDEVAQSFRELADEFVELSTDLAQSREAITQRNLDVLVYPEIGMCPLTYFLAFSRLAPLQAVWWGHPDTTGIPTIDYFISSDADLPASAFQGKLVSNRSWSGTLDEWPCENMGGDGSRPALTPTNATTQPWWCNASTASFHDLVSPTLGVDLVTRSASVTAESHPHYSERVFRLRGLGTYFYRPRIESDRPDADQKQTRELERTALLAELKASRQVPPASASEDSEWQVPVPPPPHSQRPRTPDTSVPASASGASSTSAPPPSLLAGCIQQCAATFGSPGNQGNQEHSQANRGGGTKHDTGDELRMGSRPPRDRATALRPRRSGTERVLIRPVHASDAILPETPGGPDLDPNLVDETHLNRERNASDSSDSSGQRSAVEAGEAQTWWGACSSNATRTVGRTSGASAPSADIDGCMDGLPLNGAKDRALKGEAEHDPESVLWTGPKQSRRHHLYVCPQPLFKMHSMFDRVLCGILQADPRGHVVSRCSERPCAAVVLCQRTWVGLSACVRGARLILVPRALRPWLRRWSAGASPSKRVLLDRPYGRAPSKLHVAAAVAKASLHTTPLLPGVFAVATGC